jgi:hypothetical protein
VQRGDPFPDQLAQLDVAGRHPLDNLIGVVDSHAAGSGRQACPARVSAWIHRDAAYAGWAASRMCQIWPM